MFLCILGLGLGCAEPPEPVPVDYSRREGDGCADERDNCADASTLWQCIDRSWSVTACEVVCADRGGLVGCLTPSVAPGDRCWCTDDDPACVPGQARCQDDPDAILICDDSFQFREESCQAVCQGLQPAHVSRGCGDFGTDTATCNCTTEGTACTVDDLPHCEAFELARCVDGGWVLENCSCDAGLVTCDDFGENGAQCVCTPE